VGAFLAGLATNYRLEQYLSRLTPLKTFEDLQKPLAIAATDINEGLAVYYHSGQSPRPCVLPAPTRFVCADPTRGRTLVDGFLTALVPIEGCCFWAGTRHRRLPGIQNDRKPSHIHGRAQPSFTIIQKHADLEWRQHADVIIEPDVSPYAWDDFTKTMELVRAGEEAALRALPPYARRLRASAS